jgi:hypothetical protein
VHCPVCSPGCDNRLIHYAGTLARCRTVPYEVLSYSVYEQGALSSLSPSSSVSTRKMYGLTRSESSSSLSLLCYSA